MLHEFYLKRFRYESLAATSECLTVTIDDKNKILFITGSDKLGGYPAKILLLDSISSISFGRGPNSVMANFGTAPIPTLYMDPVRDTQLLIEFQRASDQSSFHKVLKKVNGGDLRMESKYDGPFARWEDNPPQLSVEELYRALDAKDTEIKSLRDQLASACVDQPNHTRAEEPQRRYRLDDVYPFKISQVSRVVEAYGRNKEELESVRDELSAAEDDIARQQARIANLVVALLNPDAIPAILTEQDLHKYLASPSLNLDGQDVSALNDNPSYRQAVARVFGHQKSLKPTS